VASTHTTFTAPAALLLPLLLRLLLLLLCACPQPRSDLAAAASGLHPVVVRYDLCVALTAGLRRPARFLKFLSSQPDFMRPEVRHVDTPVV
jgi:hypothetical protein